jgi:hypothetical protein
MNQIIKDSPADKAGLKIGESYKVVRGNGSFPIGSTIKFTEDDGSSQPRFEGPSKDDSGWNYVGITKIATPPVKPKRVRKVAVVKAVAMKVVSKVPPKLEYSLCIMANKTTITVEKHLSTKQIAAILKLVDKE